MATKREEPLPTKADIEFAKVWMSCRGVEIFRCTLRCDGWYIGNLPKIMKDLSRRHFTGSCGYVSSGHSSKEEALKAVALRLAQYKDALDYPTPDASI